MNFPGTTRYVVAQDALEHLEQNLLAFTKIFADFHIPATDYRLLAGFDENILRANLGFLHQIYVIILLEPADMALFLSRLLPALGQFTAVVFTNKSTYHLPSSLPDFTEIARISTRETAQTLPSCFSLSSNVDTGGTLSLGAPSGQGSNGKDNSRKKDKERKDPDRFIPDSSKMGKGDGGSKSPGPESGEARDAQITFQVTTHLCQRADPSFQDLTVRGILTTERVPESQDPPRFATCELKFTEVLTSTKKTAGELQYHQFQLVVDVDAKTRRSLFSKVQPVSTPKYNPRPAEQSTNTEQTLNISRVIQVDIVPINSWTFHVADPFEQESGLPLPPEKLPSMRIEFYGKSPVPPPPTHLDVMISTYWSLLSPQEGNTWLRDLPKTTGPAFSNLCEIISLHLPSDLQGSHVYTTDLVVWPERTGKNPLMCAPSDEYQGDVENLGKTKVVAVGPQEQPGKGLVHVGDSVTKIP